LSGKQSRDTLLKSKFSTDFRLLYPILQIRNIWDLPQITGFFIVTIDKWLYKPLRAEGTQGFGEFIDYRLTI